MLRTIDNWRDAPVWTADKIEDATKTWFKFLGNEDRGRSSKTAFKI